MMLSDLGIMAGLRLRLKAILKSFFSDIARNIVNEVKYTSK